MEICTHNPFSFSWVGTLTGWNQIWYCHLYWGFSLFLALKGHRECRKILTEDEEIPPTRLSILVRKFVLVLSQQSYILSILLTKEHTSVCDFNNWYLLSTSYKPNTSITCSSDHNSGEQVLLTTVYWWEKQRLNE